MSALTQEQLNNLADETARMWIDETTDTRHMSTEAQKAAGHYREPKTNVDPFADDGFGGVDRSKKGMTLEDFANDTETLEEYARRDPAFGEKLADHRIDEVCVEFVRKTKRYLKTDKNYERIVKFLAKTYLDEVRFDSEEDTVRKLYEAGAWTVETLTYAFNQLCNVGRMEMASGEIKELSKDEKLAVIADIRDGDPEAAVINYISYSFGGQAPREYQSPRDFITAHPALSSKAVWFVFGHLTAAELTPEELADFRKDMSRHPLPTVQFLQNSLPAWRQAHRHRVMFGGSDQNKQQQAEQPKEFTSEELDRLSDAEIEELRLAAIKEYRRSQIR
jgi:hypothetical protein